MRDRAAQFADVPCVVLGVSFDPPADNKAFADAQQFGFRLLSDVDRSVGRAYETARDDNDQYAAFSQRLSYLVDPDGVIRRSYQVSDVSGHADQVLADLGALRAT